MAQWHLSTLSLTVAGPHRIFTGFPIKSTLQVDAFSVYVVRFAESGFRARALMVHARLLYVQQKIGESPASMYICI